MDSNISKFLELAASYPQIKCSSGIVCVLFESRWRPVDLTELLKIKGLTLIALDVGYGEIGLLMSNGTRIGARALVSLKKDIHGNNIVGVGTDVIGFAFYKLGILTKINVCDAWYRVDQEKNNIFFDRDYNKILCIPKVDIYYLKAAVITKQIRNVTIVNYKYAFLNARVVDNAIIVGDDVYYFMDSNLVNFKTGQIVDKDKYLLHSFQVACKFINKKVWFQDKYINIKYSGQIAYIYYIGNIYISEDYNARICEIFPSNVAKPSRTKAAFRMPDAGG